MKKIFNLILLTILLDIGVPLPTPAFTIPNSFKSLYVTNMRLQEDTKEELYKDIFITMLHPCIEQAINDYYGKPYNYAPYDITILNVERQNGYRTFTFLIKLQVMPYVGAHNTVGVDNLTIEVSYERECKVVKFEHIE